MRAGRVFISAVTAALIVGALAEPAAAGGNWIDWKRRYNVAGETVVARNVFFARSEVRVRRHGPYFAYLSPETYGWRLPDVNKPGTVRLGRVRVVWPDADSSFRGPMRFNPRARIRFTVPDLRSGNYLLAFCNRGCTRPLGSVDPSGGFRIVASALEGRLSNRVDALASRLDASRRRALRDDMRRKRASEADLAELRTAALDADSRLADLEARLARRDRAGDGSAPWILLATALLVLAASGFLVGRRRGRTATQRELDRLVETDASRRESLSV